MIGEVIIAQMRECLDVAKGKILAEVKAQKLADSFGAIGWKAVKGNYSFCYKKVFCKNLSWINLRRVWGPRDRWERGGRKTDPSSVCTRQEGQRSWGPEQGQGRWIWQIRSQETSLRSRWRRRCLRRSCPGSASPSRSGAGRPPAAGRAVYACKPRFQGKRRWSRPRRSARLFQVLNALLS